MCQLLIWIGLFEKNDYTKKKEINIWNNDDIVAEEYLLGRFFELISAEDNASIKNRLMLV